ncbi:FAD-dependent oxidoreductase [Hazenella sp. IB182357]|uniref:FAD-dependent oxidoreductase n=1 Tax=Polycladospora coralii TaxID=2771432 RepID=A0A926NCG1_9BACL|nr:FAD-dependent oxidoreductase [Polycladospora coralii]MBD1373270.1 FAD-dependent oxidoreductase [Polycladospora coralii]
MKELTCIVIGGGYAGINTIKNIRQLFHDKSAQYKLKLVLIDKNAYHLRKVLLFKPAVRDKEIKVPLTHMFSEGVDIVQAIVKKVNPKQKKIQLEDANGHTKSLNYDLLVLAIGNDLKKPDFSQSGIALTSTDESTKIREKWQANLKKASSIHDEETRRKLLTIAVCGAGISGIETAAELAYYAREDAKFFGIDPTTVNIHLINAKKRLFSNGPEKVGKKLENKLKSLGVRVIHETKATTLENDILTLSNNHTLLLGLCIWTLGMQPHPLLHNIGLATTPEGYLNVDSSYRVKEAEGVYSIGDCAQISDPLTGKKDGKTCKEAIAQAERLANVILADLEQKPAPHHQSFMELFCFGLGPEDGLVWIHKWGLDLILTGKVGNAFRKWTWSSASLISKVKEDPVLNDSHSKTMRE